MYALMAAEEEDLVCTQAGNDYAGLDCGDEVPARATEEPIFFRPAEELVMVKCSEELVMTKTAIEEIITSTT